MLGFLSFLACLCAVAFLVALVMLVVRLVKKKSWKPCAVAAAVSVVCVLGLSMPISQLYVPAEKPTEQPPSDTASAVASTANVDNSVENVDNSTAPVSEPPVSEQPVASEATSSPPAATSKTSPVPDTEPSAETEPDSSAAPSDDEVDVLETYQRDIVVSAVMVLDRFISGYDVPLAVQSWTLAKFDDAGAVAAMADVTKKSTKETVAAIVVLTPEFENEKMTGSTPHFVSVGDIVYGDDGYCDDVFSSISEMFGGLN